MRRILAVVLPSMLVATAALAAPPTDPDKADKLCEEIGSDADTSLPPDERLWFGENCTCREPIGCGLVGSPRWQKRSDAARAKELERMEAERQAEQRAGAEAVKQAQSSCARYVTCLRGNAAKVDACDEQESAFEYDCSGSLRDVEACVDRVQALRAAPEKAECADPVR